MQAVDRFTLRFLSIVDLRLLPQHIAERLCLSDTSLSKHSSRLCLDDRRHSLEHLINEILDKAELYRTVLRQSRSSTISFLSRLQLSFVRAALRPQARREPADPTRASRHSRCEATLPDDP